METFRRACPHGRASTMQAERHSSRPMERASCMNCVRGENADRMVQLSCLSNQEKEEMATATDTTKPAQEKQGARQAFVQGVHGVRYQVTDVAHSVAFYTTHLGFTLEHQQLPAFASVSLGDAQMLLSGPGASGSRPMPGGQPQEPGGWNRVVLRVNDLPAFIDALKKAGLPFRNEMERGPCGKQIQI